MRHIVCYVCKNVNRREVVAIAALMLLCLFGCVGMVALM